jgi:uncharacterized DUF497 family protein
VQRFGKSLFVNCIRYRYGGTVLPSLRSVYTISLTFEWDPDKHQANLAKHGIDFRDAVRIFEAPVLEKVDARHEYGETRIVSFGLLDDVELTVVYTMRGRTRRIISARRARGSEREAYRKIYPKPRHARQD